MHIARKDLIVALQLLLTLCPCGLAVAGPIFPGPFVAARTAANAGLVFTGDVESGVVGNRYIYSTLQSDSHASAAVDVDVEVGAMHAFSQVIATPEFDSTVVSAIDLEFGDALTAGSSTIAEGTLVPIEFSLWLRYSATTATRPTAGNYGGLFLGLDPAFDAAHPWTCAFGDFGCIPTGQIRWGYEGAPESGVLSYSFVSLLPIGQQVYFAEQLWSRNFRSVRFGAGAGTNTFDAGDTAWLQIRALDPNVAVVTLSGHDYGADPDTPPTVPEPATLGLVGLGVVGTIWRRTWR